MKVVFCVLAAASAAILMEINEAVELAATSSVKQQYLDGDLESGKNGRMMLSQVENESQMLGSLIGAASSAAGAATGA